MIANLLQITTEIGAIVFKSDVEDIFRMDRRDNSNKAPGPVLVTLTQISIRDGRKNVYINADETVEVRRAKAILRKAARNARSSGKDVEMRHDHVRIGEETYTLDDLHKIPSEYMPEPIQTDVGQASNARTSDTTGDETASSSRRDRNATARRRLNPVITQGKVRLIKPGEKNKNNPVRTLLLRANGLSVKYFVCVSFLQ